MSNKCFITKFPTAVDNNNLPLYGETSFNIGSGNAFYNSDAGTQSYMFKFAKDTELKIEGNAYFCKSNKDSTSLGNTLVVPANTEKGVFIHFNGGSEPATIKVRNKYDLQYFYDGPSAKYASGFDYRSINNLDIFKYMPKIKEVYIFGGVCSGNIDVFKDKKLLILTLNSIPKEQTTYGSYKDYWNITGNLSSLSNLTALTELVLSTTQVEGNLSSLSNLTALKVLNLPSTVTASDADIKTFTDRGCTVTIGNNIYESTKS